jgi:hypothetical protein
MDEDDIYKNIESLSLALFKEQIKVVPMMKIISLIDFCVSNVDQLSNIIIMLAGEIQVRFEEGIEQKGWSGLSYSASAFGMTPDEVIKDGCEYFTEKRAKLGVFRDKFMQVMMIMNSLEKTHKRFQSDNTEGDINGN